MNQLHFKSVLIDLKPILINNKISFDSLIEDFDIFSTEQLLNLLKLDGGQTNISNSQSWDG